MAKEWVNDFPSFLAHIGKRPSPLHTIDRINNDRGYVPGNVRWATRAEQSNNSRRCRMITFRGETLPLLAQCRKWGVKKPSLQWWIYQKGRDPVAGLEHYIRRLRA
jgi:hypothetical protein